MIVFFLFLSLIPSLSSFNFTTTANHENYKNLREFIETYKFFPSPSTRRNPNKTHDAHNRITYEIKHYLIEKQKVLTRRYHLNLLFLIKIEWEDERIEEFQNRNFPNSIDLTSFTPYLWLPLRQFDLKKHGDGNIVRWNHELLLNMDRNSFTLSFHKLHQMSCHLVDANVDQMKCESPIPLLETRMKMESYMEGNISESSVFLIDNLKEENFMFSLNLLFLHQLSKTNLYICCSILLLLLFSFALKIGSRERVYLLSILLILVALHVVSFFVSGDVFSKHYYNRIIFLTVYSTFLCIYITIFWMRLAIGDRNVFTTFPKIMKSIILHYLSFVVGLSLRTRQVNEEIIKMENEKIEEKSNSHSLDNANESTNTILRSLNELYNEKNGRRLQELYHLQWEVCGSVINRCCFCIFLFFNFFTFYHFLH